MKRTTRTTLAAVLTLAAALTVGGCSAGGSTDQMSSSMSASSGKGPVLNVTVHGKHVTPNGDRLKVKLGQPVTIHVMSDRAGQLHVHSSPEQELNYRKGMTTLKVTIHTPGVIDIEDHIANVVVTQLEVS
jgi:hypothetical protein